MNKGRNILLIMICMLMVSVLSFFTLFERSNKSGVVDNVRYIVESDSDDIKVLTLYFVEPGKTAQCTVSSDDEGATFFIDDTDYTYRYEEGSVRAYLDGEEAGDEAFSVYSRNLFKTIAKGKDRYLKFYQAGIVALVCAAGGAIILYAEELWHIIYKKGEDEIPEWKDMNGIKIAGGATIGAGAVLLVVFLII